MIQYGEIESLSYHNKEVKFYTPKDELDSKRRNDKQ